MTTQPQSIQVGNANSEIADSNLKIFYKAGGGAALTAGILLLSAMISFISSVLQPGAINGWLTLFQNNWLIVIFKIHAGFSGVQVDLLHTLNFLDIAFLALVGTMVLGLYAALRRTSRFWSMMAVALPFLGIVLFVATQTAGRSAVMGAGIVISVVMLRNKTLAKATAYLGILAIALLLVGDFSTGVLYSNIITTLFGIGYVLLIIWIILIAFKLFRLGQNTKG